MDYFQLDAVANSDFGNLRKEIYNIDENENLEFHYAFGTLVDAYLTETNREVEEALKYPFSDDDLSNANKMVHNCRRDPLIKIILPVSVGQYVYFRNFEIEHEGIVFSMPCKCKFDLLAKKYKTGLDFKTVSAATENAFLNAVDHFDWDRQAAFYMDQAKIDRFWIVAISKINSKVFKLAIQRGDKNYNNGRSKYQYWAYKYFTLIHNLNF